jgi:cellulose synthase/poly-beta-1,6-N-acetylglucosamine synthase-like glycosyltransferase
MEFSGLVIGTYLAVLLVLAFYGFHRTALVWLYYKHRDHKPKPAGRFSELPVVTVQLPLYNEMYVVERLLDAVAGIRYPRDRFQVQVLDDSTDETQDICKKKIAELAVRFPDLDVEYVHRTDRTGFKAGALHNGIKTAKGEFILIFDADFVPAPDVLERSIDHFSERQPRLLVADRGPGADARRPLHHGARRPQLVGTFLQLQRHGRHLAAVRDR